MAKRKVGSYEWRGRDSIRLEVRGGVDPLTNKSIKYRETVTDIADDEAAEKALAAFITAIEKGKYKKKSKMTIAQLAERYLRDNSDLSESTKENYKIHLEKRILPVFGDLRINKVKPTHIYDFMDNLKEDGIREDGKPGGLSPATINKNLTILSSMFVFAVELGELEENPCERVKPPKMPKRKKASIDKDPAREMLRALAKESLKWKCITLLGACTGMRRGEILGIGDNTLDLEDCIIDVDRASRHMSGGRIPLNDPKSEKSIRLVPFPRELAPLLEEMITARNKKREKCKDKWHHKIEVHGETVDNDLLFTQWNGKPMHPNSVTGWFTKFKEENNLPESLTFHGLRHTNITQLLKSGVDVGTVADNAGHAKKSTTLDYDDPDAEALREVPIKISSALDLKNIVPGLLNQPENIRRKRAKKEPEE